MESPAPPRGWGGERSLVGEPRTFDVHPKDLVKVRLGERDDAAGADDSRVEKEHVTASVILDHAADERRDHGAVPRGGATDSVRAATPFARAVDLPGARAG